MLSMIAPLLPPSHLTARSRSGILLVKVAIGIITSPPQSSIAPMVMSRYDIIVFYWGMLWEHHCGESQPLQCSWPHLPFRQHLLSTMRKLDGSDSQDLEIGNGFPADSQTVDGPQFASEANDGQVIAEMVSRTAGRKWYWIGMSAVLPTGIGGSFDESYFSLGADIHASENRLFPRCAVIRAYYLFSYREPALMAAVIIISVLSMLFTFAMIFYSKLRIRLIYGSVCGLCFDRGTILAMFTLSASSLVGPANFRLSLGAQLTSRGDASLLHFTCSIFLLFSFVWNGFLHGFARKRCCASWWDKVASD